MVIARGLSTMPNKSILLYLLIFLCRHFTAVAEIKDDDIYIDGPTLTISELWLQVEQRSPYRILHDIPKNELKAKVNLSGLVPLTQIIEMSRDTLSSKEPLIKGRTISFSLPELPSAPHADVPDLTFDAPSDKEVAALNNDQNDLGQNKPLEKSLSLDDTVQDPPNVIKHLVIDDDQDILDLHLDQIQVADESNSTPTTTPTIIFDDFNVLDNEPANDTPVEPRTFSYQIKPGDKIEISVWGEDMTRELVVSPDGKISYILIGELDILNMTFQEVKHKIELKLSKYLLEPNVTVIGKSYEGNYVSILGAVNTPGRKVVSKSDRLLDVITKAQGLRFQNFGDAQGELANLKGAYLSRRGGLVPIDFSRLLYEGDMSQNIPVEIGDFIYIPSSVRNPIFITGEVRGPTSMPFRGEPTLLEAITAAGGPNTSANHKQIFLVRGGMQSPQISTHNYFAITQGSAPNPKLEPGDIIHITPTTITKIERLSAQILPFLNVIVNSGSAKTTVQDW